MQFNCDERQVIDAEYKHHRTSASRYKYRITEKPCSIYFSLSTSISMETSQLHFPIQSAAHSPPGSLMEREQILSSSARKVLFHAVLPTPRYSFPFIKTPITYCMIALATIFIGPVVLKSTLFGSFLVSAPTNRSKAVGHIQENEKGWGRERGRKGRTYRNTSLGRSNAGHHGWNGDSFATDPVEIGWLCFSA